MITTPELITTKAIITAVIPLRIPCQDMGRYMDPAILEVIKAITRQDIQITGPMFTYHKRLPTDFFDFEIGFPVSGTIKEEGRVINSTLPVMNVVRAVYEGPYSGLVHAWGELQQWVEANGYKGTGRFWECYLNNPEEVKYPKDYRTELNWIIE